MEWKWVKVEMGWNGPVGSTNIIFIL